MTIRTKFDYSLQTMKMLCELNQTKGYGVKKIRNALLKMFPKVFNGDKKEAMIMAKHIVYDHTPYSGKMRKEISSSLDKDLIELDKIVQS